MLSRCCPMRATARHVVHGISIALVVVLLLGDSDNNTGMYEEC